MEFQLAFDRSVFMRDLQQQATALGFDYFACGICIPFHVTRPQIIMINNYPVAWQARYAQANYLTRDPTVAHVRQSFKPLAWGDATFGAARDLWEDARSHGVRYGWSQATYDARSVGVMFTLARSHEPLGVRELAVKDGLLRALSSHTIQRLLDALVPAPRDWLHSAVTQSQLNVLRWIAEGKTCGEIAKILGISRHTARFHLDELLHRLEAPNKTAVAVRGWVLGAYIGC